MRYTKERQYCLRLNLARPEQEKLCRFIEERDREKYPYLPGYLLAACEELELHSKDLPECDISEGSLERIRDELAILIAGANQAGNRQA